LPHFSWQNELKSCDSEDFMGACNLPCCTTVELLGESVFHSVVARILRLPLYISKYW